jgi:hypothetical protein
MFITNHLMATSMNLKCRGKCKANTQQVEPMTPSPPSSKWFKEGRKVKSRLIADTFGNPKTLVLRIQIEDLKKSWFFFLLHDNAPAHSAAIIRQFLTQKQVATLNRPPYSPDLSPPRLLPVPEGEGAAEGFKI